MSALRLAFHGDAQSSLAQSLASGATVDSFRAGDSADGTVVVDGTSHSFDAATLRTALDGGATVVFANADDAQRAVITDVGGSEPYGALPLLVVRRDGGAYDVSGVSFDAGEEQRRAVGAHPWPCRAGRSIAGGRRRGIARRARSHAAARHVGEEKLLSADPAEEPTTPRGT
jgi:hypothetical protein